MWRKIRSAGTIEAFFPGLVARVRTLHRAAFPGCGCICGWACVVRFIAHRHLAHPFAALAFDHNGVLSKGLGRDGGVDAEALVDAQSGIPGQAGDGGVLPAAIRRAGEEEAVEFPIALGAVGLVEAAGAPALPPAGHWRGDGILPSPACRRKSKYTRTTICRRC